jgi:hypothetical protein
MGSFQTLRQPEFAAFGLFWQPGCCRLRTPLGSWWFMPPPWWA